LGHSLTARAFTKLGLRSSAELATMLERFDVKREKGAAQ